MLLLETLLIIYLKNDKQNSNKSAVVLQIRHSYKFYKLHKKTPVQESLFKHLQAFSLQLYFETRDFSTGDCMYTLKNFNNTFLTKH